MADPEKVKKSAEELKEGCEYFRTVAKIAAVVPVFGWLAAAAASAGASQCDKSMDELAAQNADLWADLQSDDVKAAYDRRVQRERDLRAQGKPKGPQVKLGATDAQKKAYWKAYDAYLENVKEWEARTPPPLYKPEEWQAMTQVERRQWQGWVDRYTAGKKALKGPAERSTAGWLAAGLTVLTGLAIWGIKTRRRNAPTLQSEAERYHRNTGE